MNEPLNYEKTSIVRAWFHREEFLRDPNMGFLDPELHNSGKVSLTSVPESVALGWAGIGRTLDAPSWRIIFASGLGDVLGSVRGFVRKTFPGHQPRRSPSVLNLITTQRLQTNLLAVAWLPTRLPTDTLVHTDINPIQRAALRCGA